MTASVPGLVAALLWALLCVRWFDVAAPWRPAVLGAIPPLLLALGLAGSLGVLAARVGRRLFVLPEGASRRDLTVLVLLAIAFRLPMVWTAAVGYTTPDGSLSGIVAHRVREGLAHLVFVPSVPYSGSLKSHLTAALATVVDLSRAFALTSVFFYAAFVAVVYLLAVMVEPRSARRGWLAALYVIFAPAFITRYSLSNDGNYVEVLALGTFALWLAARAHRADDVDRGLLAWVAGIALGLAFWCHILAILHASAVAAAFIVAARMRSLPHLLRLAAGAALGYLPGLLWNAANGWESFAYVLPGGRSVGSLESGPALGVRWGGMWTDQWAVLLGYDPGYPRLVDMALVWAARIAKIAVLVAFVRAAGRVRSGRDFTLGLLLLFAAVNLAVASFALPYIPGNPRYLLFLAAPIAIVLADAYGWGRRRVVFSALLLLGVATSWGQWPSAMHADARWRGFVADLRAAGVSHCYTDFYIAAKLDMLSEESIVCASDLGPTTTEYFRDYPARVAAAPRVALIPVNTTAADKLERRLARAGVGYVRLDRMKPVLIPDRPVHPSELFPASSVR